MHFLTRIPVLLGLAAMAISCGADEADICDDAIQRLVECTGSVPDGFDGLCAADPDHGARLAETVCGNEKGDTFSGWVEKGGNCFDFNIECKSGLVCRPEDVAESSQVCLPPGGSGALCDDDADCAPGHLCLGELEDGRADAKVSTACFGMVIELSNNLSLVLHIQDTIAAEHGNVVIDGNTIKTWVDFHASLLEIGGCSRLGRKD